MECAVRTKRMTEPDRQRVTDILRTFGLPLSLPQHVDTAELNRAMQYDKKAAPGRRWLVVPTGIGSALMTDDVPDDVVNAAWAAVDAAK